MTASDLPDVGELCRRLHRDTSAQAVLVCAPDGEILGHAGPVGALDDALIDAIGDATVETLSRAAPAAAQSVDEAGERGTVAEGEERLWPVGEMRLCSAALADRAVLMVAFVDESRLGLVRLRMKRARELILRTLEAG
jgi:hypothetical protein